MYCDEVNLPVPSLAEKLKKYSRAQSCRSYLILPLRRTLGLPPWLIFPFFCCASLQSKLLFQYRCFQWNLPTCSESHEAN